MVMATARGYNRCVARRFTLLDDVYYEALRTVVRSLLEAGLDFCLVGGGAVQAWLISLRTEDGRRPMGDEAGLRTALRATRDLDFATRADPATMVAMLNTMAAAIGHGAHVLGPRSLRLGPVSVALTIEPSDLTGMAELYDTFLQSRTPLRLRKGGHTDEVPTIGLPELLATKLTRRGDKAKDIVDVTRLMGALRDVGRSVDSALIRKLVGDRTEALALLQELERRVREEEP